MPALVAYVLCTNAIEGECVAEMMKLYGCKKTCRPKFRPARLLNELAVFIRRLSSATSLSSFH